MRPQVAFFSFASCEGCQLVVLECEDELLDLVGAVDIIRFREAMDPVGDQSHYDIAFIEGSMTREEDVAKLKQIRERTDILIALGACAWPGGVNALKNLQPLDAVRRSVYGDKADVFDTMPTAPIDAYVKTDYFLRGCPIDRTEFLECVKALLLGKPPVFKDYPMCVECKLRENACLFHKGYWCLGPVVRAGCGAICPSHGDACEGCRGPIDHPNRNAHVEVLREFGLTADDIMKRFQLFGTYLEQQRAQEEAGSR